MACKKICKNVLFIFLFGMFVQGFLCSCLIQSDSSAVAVGPFSNLKTKIVQLFRGKPDKAENYSSCSVLLGGVPLGFTLQCDGVVVIGVGEVKTSSGEISPCGKCGIKAGDVLKTINNCSVDSAESIGGIVNFEADLNKELVVSYLRKDKLFSCNVKPALDVTTGEYKLGLWIRDNAAGVGTLTFVREDNLRFGALGHPVCDIDTGTTMPVSSGSVFKCNIVGVEKAQKGKPGEIKGLFLKGGKPIGEIDSNNTFGVYGKAGESLLNMLSRRVEVARRDEVKPGKASIVCNVDGLSKNEFDIDIVKTNYQSQSKSKSMVIRVTDQELIDKTGGIVQGMSGSPIIQNGKLIGAVTHVFVSDPTKGFGIYAEWMIDK